VAAAAPALGYVHHLRHLHGLLRRFIATYRGAGAAARLDVWRLLAGTPPAVVEGLLAALGGLVEGVPFVIELRGELLAALRGAASDGSGGDAAGALMADLRKLDHTLKTGFARQVAVELRRIRAGDSAELLEFIRAREAVQPVADDADLQHRLEGEGRVCYGLFHPFMPRHPLVFVYVALRSSEGPGATIDDILAVPRGVGGNSDGGSKAGDRTPPPCTAVFYSITNAMPGLAGLQLASYLLFLAVEALSRAHPTLRDFITLSPAPGLPAWVTARLGEEASEEGLEDMLTPAEAEALCATGPASLSHAYTPAEVAAAAAGGVGARGSSQPPPYSRTRAAAVALRSLRGWEGMVAGDGSVAGVPPLYRHLLLKWAVAYILFARDRTGRRCLDPVANFHVSNGATVDDILFGAAASRRGWRASYSIMVSYRYDFSRGAIGARAYARSGTLAATRAAALLQAVGMPTVFDGVDPAVLSALAQPIGARTVAPGEWMYRADDADTHALYIVVAGVVDIFTPPAAGAATAAASERAATGAPCVALLPPLAPYDAAGLRAVGAGRATPTAVEWLAAVGAGAAVGALPLLEGRRAYAYFRARTQCNVLVVPLPVIAALVRDYPAAAATIRTNARTQLLRGARSALAPPAADGGGGGGGGGDAVPPPPARPLPSFRSRL